MQKYFLLLNITGVVLLFFGILILFLSKGDYIFPLILVGIGSGAILFRYYLKRQQVASTAIRAQNAQSIGVVLMIVGLIAAGFIIYAYYKLTGRIIFVIPL